jgi:hypothetical protein
VLDTPAQVTFRLYNTAKMSSISEKRSQPTTLSALRLTVDHARITDQVLSHQYPGAGTPESPYIVSFLPSEPGNPFNWSKSYKWTCTMIAALATLSTAFASSAYSGTLRELVTAFDPNPSLELLTAGICKDPSEQISFILFLFLRHVSDDGKSCLTEYQHMLELRLQS